MTADNSLGKLYDCVRCSIEGFLVLSNGFLISLSLVMVEYAPGALLSHPGGNLLWLMVFSLVYGGRTHVPPGRGLTSTSGCPDVR